MLNFVWRRSFPFSLPVLLPSLLVFFASLFPALVAKAASPAGQAVTTAALRGVLVDPADEPITGASLSLESLPAVPGAQAAQTTSGADGGFEFAVAPGRYRLRIQHESFVTSDQQLTLAAGANPALTIRLAIQPLAASIVVSASPEPEPASAVTSPVSIVTRAEIDQRQANDLAPLLQQLPGLAYDQTGPAGGVTALFLDGGNSNYTKFLVDGISANEPGGGVDFSYFTLENIDKIEVVHGAQSALDGSDAMTGSVEVLTHRGTTRIPQLVLVGEGGSFDTGRGSAQLSGLVRKWLDYSVDYGYFETQGRGVNDRFLNRAISGNFGIRFAPTNTLRLTVRSNASDAGQAGQTLFTPPDLNEHNNLHNLTAGAAWNFRTGSHWQHQITASETAIQQIFDNPLSDFFLSPDPFHECDSFSRSPNAVPSPLYCDFPFFDRNLYSRADFQAQSSYVTRKATLTAGYWYEVENGIVAFLNEEHVRRNNQAGFIDAHWQPLRRLTVDAGFRAEHNTSFGTRVIPRAGAAYVVHYGSQNFLGDTRLRFSYGDGIKEPKLYESFGTDPCNPGNANLLPEQTHSLHAGVDQQLDHDRITLSGDYFDNRFIDAISFNELPPTMSCPFGVGQYFNTDLAHARGTSLDVQARPRSWLHLRGNYTFDDSRILISPNATNSAELPGNHLLRRPVNAGTIVVDTPFRRFDGNLTVLFVGRRTDSDFLFPSLGLTSNPGYVRVDLAAGFRVTPRLTLTARVQNLFNADYTDVLGYPTLGRVAYGGLRLRIGGNE